MLKKIFIILIVLGFLAYLTYAMAMFSGSSSEVKCKNVTVQVMDEDEHTYVKDTEILQMMERNGVSLKGKKMGSINYEFLEKIVESHSIVERAESFASPSGTVCIKVWQHLPVLRVISPLGNYYIDSKGEKTGLSIHSAANVIVASGAIKDSITIRELYRMAVVLQSEPAWDALVEQIYVENNGEWILIPRAGDFEIVFGMPVNMETKMKRVSTFVREYLPKMGWDKYSQINFKFENQIICTKKVI